MCFGTYHLNYNGVQAIKLVVWKHSEKCFWKPWPKISKWLVCRKLGEARIQSVEQPQLTSPPVFIFHVKQPARLVRRSYAMLSFQSWFSGNRTEFYPNLLPSSSILPLHAQQLLVTHTNAEYTLSFITHTNAEYTHTVPHRVKRRSSFVEVLCMPWLSRFAACRCYGVWRRGSESILWGEWGHSDRMCCVVAWFRWGRSSFLGGAPYASATTFRKFLL